MNTVSMGLRDLPGALPPSRSFLDDAVTAVTHTPRFKSSFAIPMRQSVARWDQRLRRGRRGYFASMQCLHRFLTSLITVDKLSEADKLVLLDQANTHFSRLGRQYEHGTDMSSELKCIGISHGGQRNDQKDGSGKYILMGDEEESRFGMFNKPLPCFGCGVGWFSFLVGFLCPVMWYYATILYFGNYYRKDPRERGGLAASAVAACACTLVLFIIILVILL